MEKLPNNISNPELYRLKVSLIDRAAENISNCQQSYSCNYQDIPLTFKWKEGDLDKQISELIPSSWMGPVSNSYTIYYLDPQEFGISLENWENESSQDCYIHEGNKLAAIQRDFVAFHLNEKELILVGQVKVDDSFYNFLRWFLPRQMMNNGAFVLHSSCIVNKDGQANFFLGPSGAGKTTMASMAQGRTILGDDMNVIVKDGDRYYAKAGAIGGVFYKGVDYSKKYPIGKFFWLIQGDSNSKEIMAPMETTSKLLASLANIFWDTLEEKQVHMAMDFAVEIQKQYSMYYLNFKKDPSVWEVVDGE